MAPRSRTRASRRTLPASVIRKSESSATITLAAVERRHHEQRLAEREPRARALVLVVDRRVGVEARVREALPSAPRRRRKSASCVGSREDAQARAAVRGELRRVSASSAASSSAYGLRRALRAWACARDRGRRDRAPRPARAVGRAEARRVIRVAFDLGRAALVAVHEQAERLAAAVQHRRVVRAARPAITSSGVVRVRQDLLDRAADAALEPASATIAPLSVRN